MNAIDLQHEVRTLIEPTVERLGYGLVGVEWLGDGRGAVLRLSIDRSGGITADDCAKVSEHVSPVLDQADPIAVRYHLEVSSPGIERPVQRAADFERFLGHRLRVRLVAGLPRRKYTGELIAFDGDEIALRVDAREHRIALDTVERANLVLTLDEYRALAEVDHDDQ